MAHVEHEGFAAIIIPDGRRLDAKALAVKLYEALVVGGGEGDAELQNRGGWIWHRGLSLPGYLMRDNRQGAKVAKGCGDDYD
jgi:hypothetical protein